MLRGAFAGLHAAVSFFTWVPVPPVEVDRPTARRAIAALPWVGLGLGAAAAAASGLVLLADAGAHLAAIVGLAVVAALSGAMHLDGLADTVDGLGSRRPPAEALAVMRRSDIGPMGVATIVLVLLLDAAALASPSLAGPALPAALLVMPLVGRVPVLAGTSRRSPSARAEGFGALFAEVTSDIALSAGATAALGVCALVGALAARGTVGAALFCGATLLAWAVAALWQRHLVRRLGGFTGDTLGSLVEVTQTAFVLVLALSVGWASALV